MRDPAKNKSGSNQISGESAIRNFDGGGAKNDVTPLTL
jgi:hypothetical protein